MHVPEILYLNMHTGSLLFISILEYGCCRHYRDIRINTQTKIGCYCVYVFRLQLSNLYLSIIYHHQWVILWCLVLFISSFLFSTLYSSNMAVIIGRRVLSLFTFLISRFIYQKNPENRRRSVLLVSSPQAPAQ